MSSRQFQNYYGINLNTNDGRWEAALAMSQRPTASEFSSYIAPALGAKGIVFDNETWLTVTIKPAVYAGGLEAENQIAMGLTVAINISLGILKKDYLGALSMRNDSYNRDVPTDFSNSNWALAIGGGIFGAMEGAAASQGYWLGKNGKYYPNQWGGNQYTGSRAGAFRAANAYKLTGKATVFLSAGIGVYSTIEGYQLDGGKFGYNAQMAAVSSIGGILGGIAGAKGGAAVGAAIGVWFGGVGAVPGAIIGGVIGGVIGGIGGGLFGSYFGESAVNYYHGR
jgi:hypothetical protein